MKNDLSKKEIERLKNERLKKLNDNEIIRKDGKDRNSSIRK